MIKMMHGLKIRILPSREVNKTDKYIEVSKKFIERILRKIRLKTKQTFLSKIAADDKRRISIADEAMTSDNLSETDKLISERKNIY